MGGTRYVPKTWGHEQHIVNLREQNYCGKILQIVPGHRCSIHFHVKKHETFFLLEGRLRVEIWIIPCIMHKRAARDPKGLARNGVYHDPSERLDLTPGDTLILPPFQAHRFEAIGGIAKFIEFSNYDDPKDSYRIVDAGPCHA